MKPHSEREDLTLYCGDALEVLRTLPPASVDAIVTSPPYADARSDINGQELSVYVGWFEPILAELLRVVKPAGSMMLNLGRIFRDYQESGYAFDVLAAAKRLGWQHAETVIWHKPNALPLSGPYLVPRHEYVWWLAKDARACYRGIEETRQVHAEESLLRYRRNGYLGSRKGGRARNIRPLNENGARAGSVVSSYIGREKGNPHPSPMPIDLAEHLVLLSAPAGALVLDPFAGSGNTAIASVRLQRRAIGIELDRTFCDLIIGRLQQQISLLT